MKPLILLTAFCTLSACDSLFCDDCGMSFPTLFESGITAGATPGVAVYDRPIIVRAAVLPRFTGTGAFRLNHIAGGRTAEVIAPSEGIIGLDGVEVRVEFEAGVPEVVEWTIQLGPRNGYVDGHGLPISVFADSVEVGGVLRPAESAEVWEAFDGEVVTYAEHYPRLVLR